MKKKLLIGFGILGVLFLWSGISIYPDWLWFKNLNFSPVFWTMLLSRFGFGLVVWVLLMIILLVNLYVANRVKAESGQGTTSDVDEGIAQLGLSGRALNTLLIAVILIVSFVMAYKASSRWDMVLRWWYQQPFGTSDPIFNRDMGFYVFSLPFYMAIREGLLLFLFFAGGLSVYLYLKDGVLKIADGFAQTEGVPTSLPEISITPKAKKHLVFLGGIIVLLLAWGFHLKVYGLMYSTQGPAFGASWTDIHIKIWAYRVLIIASLGFAGILFYNVSNFRMKLLWLSGGIWVGTVLLFVTVLPILVQKIVVNPNELAKESPYIAYNIRHTREAYDLSKIKEVDFKVGDKLTAEDIEKHDVTIQNIRIWDERPLLQTYRQIQSIRLYYDFHNVDVDRYLINGRYRQLMLAARELDVDQLPPQAKTWVNSHLIYTHGYGLAASPVNEVTREGLPRLFIKDLPPSFEDDLKIERPEIYF